MISEDESNEAPGFKILAALKKAAGERLRLRVVINIVIANFEKITLGFIVLLLIVIAFSLTGFRTGSVALQRTLAVTKCDPAT